MRLVLKGALNGNVAESRQSFRMNLNSALKWWLQLQDTNDDNGTKKPERKRKARDGGTNESNETTSKQRKDDHPAKPKNDTTKLNTPAKPAPNRALYFSIANFNMPAENELSEKFGGDAQWAGRLEKMLKSVEKQVSDLSTSVRESSRAATKEVNKLVDRVDKLAKGLADVEKSVGKSLMDHQNVVVKHLASLNTAITDGNPGALQGPALSTRGSKTNRSTSPEVVTPVSKANTPQSNRATRQSKSNNNSTSTPEVGKKRGRGRGKALTLKASSSSQEIGKDGDDRSGDSDSKHSNTKPEDEPKKKLDFDGPVNDKSNRTGGGKVQDQDLVDVGEHHRLVEENRRLGLLLSAKPLPSDAMDARLRLLEENRRLEGLYRDHRSSMLYDDYMAHARFSGGHEGSRARDADALPLQFQEYEMPDYSLRFPQRLQVHGRGAPVPPRPSLPEAQFRGAYDYGVNDRGRHGGMGRGLG